jgi:hypothetical protein
MGAGAPRMGAMGGLLIRDRARLPYSVRICGLTRWGLGDWQSRFTETSAPISRTLPKELGVSTGLTGGQARSGNRHWGPCVRWFWGCATSHEECAGTPRSVRQRAAPCPIPSRLVAPPACAITCSISRLAWRIPRGMRSGTPHLPTRRDRVEKRCFLGNGINGEMQSFSMAYG